MSSEDNWLPILNVDDSAPTRFLRSRILERAGYEVREVESAAQAIACGISEAPPDLILLDVALADGDGFSVCEAIKAANPTVPIVMISTVYRTGQARRDGFHVGADEYLIEPIDPERLIDAVRRFLAPKDSGAALPLPMVVTDSGGRIISANTAAARLLNLSTKGVKERSLITFFVSDRERIVAQMRRASGGQPGRDAATLRPRDRKPFRVQLEIRAADFERGGGSLEWVLEPVVTPEA